MDPEGTYGTLALSDKACRPYHLHAHSPNGSQHVTHPLSPHYSQDVPLYNHGTMFPPSRRRLASAWRPACKPPGYLMSSAAPGGVEDAMIAQRPAVLGQDVLAFSFCNTLATDLEGLHLHLEASRCLIHLYKAGLPPSISI
jgi:hypothetical protein